MATLEARLKAMLDLLGPDIKGLLGKTAPITVASGNTTFSGDVTVNSAKSFLAKGLRSGSNGTGDVGAHAYADYDMIKFAGACTDGPPAVNGVFNIGDVMLSINSDDDSWSWWVCTSGSPVQWQRIGATSRIVLPFSSGGAQTVKTGQLRVPMFGIGRLKTVKATLGTAPTGTTTFKVDVNKNGSSIYGTQANRPTWVSGANNATVGAHSIDIFGDGEYYTIDVDAVGSTVAGSDLVVVLETIRWI